MKKQKNSENVTKSKRLTIGSRVWLWVAGRKMSALVTSDRGLSGPNQERIFGVTMHSSSGGKLYMEITRQTLQEMMQRPVSTVQP